MQALLDRDVKERIAGKDLDPDRSLRPNEAAWDLSVLCIAHDSKSPPIFNSTSRCQVIRVEKGCKWAFRAG